MFGLNLLFSILLFNSTQTPPAETTKTTISDAEYELYELIMEYRAEKGLKRIPLSNALTFVAQTHCKDMAIVGLTKVLGQVVVTLQIMHRRNVFGTNQES